MKRIVSVLLISGVLFSCVISAYAIDVYTFKKKRVDQQLKGNRGYIMGTPPAPEPRKDKRTLIGIDIELPGIAEDSQDAGECASKEDSTPENKPVTFVSDEDWIK
jgi:hypothetical protein